MTKTPYIKRIPGRSGFYAQRAVPRPLQDKLGKKTWIKKVGNTMQEARRNLAEFLNATDVEIAHASGQINEAFLKDVDSVPSYGFEQDLQTQRVDPTELYPNHSLEDAHKLVERQLRREQGLPYADRTWEQLLTLAAKLKSPSPQTFKSWQLRVKEVLKIIGKNDPTKITADDARKYRDYMLETVAAVTLKNRVRSIKGILNVAKAEDWIDTNPFDALNLKMIKSKPKRKQAVELFDVDQKVRDGKLKHPQDIIYWIMRYTGTHIAEASGILYKDIDLENGLLHIVDNDLRPCKNYYRPREIPMLDELKEVLAQLKPDTRNPNAHVFPSLYNENEARWGHSLNWKRNIGVSPKACRDCVATTLRNVNVNERTIGAIFGHTPKNATGVYGASSLEAQLEALQNLVND